jgi:hypothetical protein
MATNSMLQVSISATLRDQLEREANRKGVKVTELIRHLILANCGPREEK